MVMVTGNENTVLSEFHKTVYDVGLKLHFKLLRLNCILLSTPAIAFILFDGV